MITSPWTARIVAPPNNIYFTRYLHIFYLRFIIIIYINLIPELISGAKRKFVG